MNSEGLTVFFPAYNEKENVRFMIESAKEVLEGLCERWEIILVDDGSTDGTAAIAESIALEDSRIRVVRHGRNLGFGSAIRTGIAHSRMPWIFYTDCDGQFDLNEIDKVLSLRDKADIVSAYRHRRKDPWMRLLYSIAYGAVTSVIFGGGFKDTDASFKLFRRSIFEVIKPESTSGVVDFEILLLAEKKGYSVIQIPVSHYPRRAGQVSFETVRNGIFTWVKVSAITEMFAQLLKLRIRIWRGDV